MIEKAKVYGFGSFFTNKDTYRDIDILIIHKSTSYKSCKFSLYLKKTLHSKISGLDVVILSKAEAKQLKFIEKSKAKYLGSINEDTADHDINEMMFINNLTPTLRK